eukprot:COSAG03_NODE_2981_length_2313_cov_3.934909_2_plen_219_part_00
MGDPLPGGTASLYNIQASCAWTMTSTSSAPVVLLAAALAASINGGPHRAAAHAPQPACLPPHHNLSFCDASLPAAQRAARLVGLLTVEELVSQMVDSMAAIPRLGIGNYTYGIEALHGVAGDCPFPGVGGRCFTSFATSSASAASFNRSLWYSIGRAQVSPGSSGSRPYPVASDPDRGSLTVSLSLCVALSLCLPRGVKHVGRTNMGSWAGSTCVVHS